MRGVEEARGMQKEIGMVRRRHNAFWKTINQKHNAKMSQRNSESKIRSKICSYIEKRSWM